MEKPRDLAGPAVTRLGQDGSWGARLSDAGPGQLPRFRTGVSAASMCAVALVALWHHMLVGGLEHEVYFPMMIWNNHPN